MVKLQFLSSEKFGDTLSLLLLPGPLWLGVVIPDEIPFMSQIDLLKYIVLDRITWYHITLSRQMICIK